MFRKNKYDFWSSKELEPSGWLYDQLKTQMNGLSGHLHEIWPDIRDSKWIGGSCEGWERVPYWLDGFIPLAYLLRDESKIAVSKKYIDAILAGQKEDGWICPCEDQERSRYDMWALFLICKVLVVYYECSGDERIEPAVRKALHSLLLHIRGNTLFNWASARWFECLIPIYWLYERTKEDWLLYLAHVLQVQGTGYRELFEDWRDQIPHTDWNFQTHGVNLAMALKSELLASKMQDSKDALADAQKRTALMYDQIMKFHGSGVGIFTADENLSGHSPIQGTELCAVVEEMYSFEQNFAISGDVIWLDRLEKVAYNAFPATLSPDMWTHQYDQMVNQIACVSFKGKPIFGTNGRDAHLFGLEPNYGCCTANFNQGFPKLALSTIMRREGGILVTMLGPAKLSTTVKGTSLQISVETEYPFGNTAKITVSTDSPLWFDLDLRIPSCASAALLDGEEVTPGTILTFSRSWEGSQTISLSMSFESVLESRPEDLYILRRGPLYYSVPIKERWEKHEYTNGGVIRKYPYCDYEIYPESAWNYAFTDSNFEVEYHGISNQPFSDQNPPITVHTTVAKIGWGEEEGYENVCARVPQDRNPIAYEKIEMKPYGCTNLRMTEMPLVKP